MLTWGPDDFGSHASPANVAFPVPLQRAALIQRFVCASNSEAAIGVGADQCPPAWARSPTLAGQSGPFGVTVGDSGPNSRRLNLPTLYMVGASAVDPDIDLIPVLSATLAEALELPPAPPAARRLIQTVGILAAAVTLLGAAIAAEIAFGWPKITPYYSGWIQSNRAWIQSNRAWLDPVVIGLSIGFILWWLGPHTGVERRPRTAQRVQRTRDSKLWCVTDVPSAVTCADGAIPRSRVFHARLDSFFSGGN